MIKPWSLDDYRNSIVRLNQQAQYGCGNHGCDINPPKGMGTNAGCRCYPRNVARDLRRLADLVEGVGGTWGKKG